MFQSFSSSFPLWIDVLILCSLFTLLLASLSGLLLFLMLLSRRRLTSGSNLWVKQNSASSRTFPELKVYQLYLVWWLLLVLLLELAGNECSGCSLVPDLPICSLAKWHWVKSIRTFIRTRERSVLQSWGKLVSFLCRVECFRNIQQLLLVSTGIRTSRLWTLWIPHRKTTPPPDHKPKHQQNEPRPSEFESVEHLQLELWFKMAATLTDQTQMWL